MNRDAIREAATRILVSYLRTHQTSADQVPELVTAVGQALSPRMLCPEAEDIIPPTRGHRRFRSDQFPVPDVRVEHPGEPDMFSDAAGDAEPDMLSVTPTKRGRRSRRDLAEADAETHVVEGVTVTRIPEVRGKGR